MEASVALLQCSNRNDPDPSIQRKIAHAPGLPTTRSNHHAFEYSAAHGLEWWQVDFSYYLIRSLELAGLAWDVKRPTDAQKAKLAVKP
jgi:hypothetical protein